ncbi:MAG: AAA family ATPase, partial [Actinomycetes bacterium]
MTPAVACLSCGADAPAGARFCPACGASLAPAPPMATERKIVTTLFADLVGFTALGERNDPEDVDAVLRAYYEMARGVIERFGGTVEKFIGDAVAGVFGVPIAHEDDPERAVRAALAIVDGMAALEGLGGERMLVRVAVNTGRAVVRLDALPHAGEGALVGDAVNTTARLLEAAPPMGVVAGERTYKLTARTILYEELMPVAAKGKSQPVRRWLAHGAVARRGSEDGGGLTPMIDREVELGVLTGLVDKAIASSSPQFALIVGEAGMGKSRLVLEFFRALEARTGFLGTWRQGRCPPYGDGLSFWALREMVSAHAGVLQTDSQAVVEEKLERALGDGAADPWLLSRLRPLVGLPAPQSERDENFAAWLQFFEGLARVRPTILVIEDVHWASDQTLAFLGHLTRHASGVPLLALGTARPEFLDAHPGFNRFADLVTRIDLKSLTEEESGRLANNLPGATAVPDIAKLVSARSGGNPLFTEELVRYVVERQTTWPGGDPPRVTSSRQGATEVAAEAPDSITTLIAARLDALPADYRAMLADAAVVGPVFWPGAVSALGGRSAREVERT